MKPHHRSRTNWFGVALIVGGVAVELLPQLQAQGVEIPAWVLSVVGACVIALRQITTQPVGKTDTEEGGS